MIFRTFSSSPSGGSGRARTPGSNGQEASEAFARMSERVDDSLDGPSPPTEHLANEPMPHHHPVQFRESCRQSGVAMRRMILSVFGGLLVAALLISPAHVVKPVIVPQSQ
jgi:hypothetical protein